MQRTTFGWSFTFVLALGGVVACSSKSTDEGTGTGGHGALVGGSSNNTSGNASGGTGGTSGTSGTTGGTAGTGRAGNSATAGSPTSGACTDMTITCVDATMATGCNPETGVVETFSCIDDAKALGIVSTGCTKDPVAGDSCDFTDFSDMECADGIRALGTCDATVSNTELVNAYINCFQDYMGARQIVTCFNKYVTATMTTAADCNNAASACLPGAGGAADTGAGGAGGAP